MLRHHDRWCVFVREMSSKLFDDWTPNPVTTTIFGNDNAQPTDYKAVSLLGITTYLTLGTSAAPDKHQVLGRKLRTGIGFFQPIGRKRTSGLTPSTSTLSWVPTEPHQCLPKKAPPRWTRNYDLRILLTVIARIPPLNTATRGRLSGGLITSQPLTAVRVLSIFGSVLTRWCRSFLSLWALRIPIFTQSSLHTP